MNLNDIPNPPLHNLLTPHDNRYWMDERGCLPNCQYRQWTEKYLRPVCAGRDEI